MNNIIYLKVGPLIYEITSDVPCRINEKYSEYFFSDPKKIEDFQRFRKIRCMVRMVDRFSNIEGALLYENPERMIFGYEGREYRLHAGIKGVCGIYREPAGRRDYIEIELNRMEIPKFEINLIFLEMLAMERYLVEENALVLHSAYIISDGRGIVFTAPSGTGKSTQADLWHRYAGAEIINGDRSILWWNPEKERFDICGLPFCGSSGINKNISAPLSTVVFLSQAKANHAEICSDSESIRKMFGEMSVNQWNPRAVQKSLELIRKIAESVLMVKLECNMKPDAVETLRSFIDEKSSFR